MQPPKHLVIVAGEESGDIHAATFIREIKAREENIQITGIGGHHMREAGAEVIYDLAEFGVTGISEVIKHLNIIRQAFKKIKEHLHRVKPDLLVLVDYPGFNLRLAKYAKKKLGIQILYYISPQIWAWKTNRIHTIRRYIDHMAVIFPFEKALYEKANVPVSFVGHPLVDMINACIKRNPARKDLNLPNDKRLIAILPGSRNHEIEQHMPIIAGTLEQLNQQFDDLHFVFPVASTIKPEKISAYLPDNTKNYSLIQDRAIDTVAVSDYCVVASGTASLECALLTKCMCIIYRASLFTYAAGIYLTQINYLGLCNLLQNEMIVPELLQDDCNAHELTRVLKDFLSEKEFSSHIEEKLNQLKTNLSLDKADITISELILNQLLPYIQKKDEIT